MNNYKRPLILVAIGAALWVALRFSGTQEPPTLNGGPTPADLPLPTTGVVAPGGESAEVLPPQPTSSPLSALPLLGPHLRKIGECLQINNALNDQAELSFSELRASLRGDFGELTTQTLEWKNIHVTLPNGEKRRIRLESEAEGEEGSAMRLMYFGVDKEDLPVPIPLSDEQSLNPSESFIASLENEGTVTLREDAHHGFYSNGAEIFYSERNGALSELEISFEGKNVSCQDLQNPRSTCDCF